VGWVHFGESVQQSHAYFAWPPIEGARAGALIPAGVGYFLYRSLEADRADHLRISIRESPVWRLAAAEWRALRFAAFAAAPAFGVALFFFPTQRDVRRIKPDLIRLLKIDNYAVKALAVAILLLAGAARAQTVGLDLASLHIPSGKGMRDINPGLYVETDSRLVAGTYLNSLGRMSVFAGASVDRGAVSLTAGLVYGYQRRQINCTTAWVGQTPVLGRVCGESDGMRGAIAPLLNPSVRLPAIMGFTPRVVLVPPWSRGSSAVLHLAVQRHL